VNEKNKNLAIRIASAAVLLPIILFLLFRGGLYSAGLLAVSAAVCAGEYYTIVYKRLWAAAWVGIGVAALLPLLPALAPVRMGEAAFWLLAGFFFFAWIFQLLSGGVLQEAPTRAAHLVTGCLYGGVGMMALSALRLREDGFWWAFAALVITWLNDTMAYFAGRFLGRRKLYPAVSPNKTWEGFLGGLLGSVLGLFILRAVAFPVLTVVDCLVLGVLGGLLGPMGDLCESMLKRAYGVKDSSRLVPGHGGMLDRIDALLFNAPLVFLYVTFLRDLLN
jgi:phosphatidate cytidylyltransferase